MSKSVTLVPFALASDGTLILNAAALDGPITPKALLARALRGPGKIFVGIELTRAEAAAVVRRTQGVTGEIAAYAAGARQRGQLAHRPRKVGVTNHVTKGRHKR